MGKEDFLFGVNTMVGSRYSILKDLERKYTIEKGYLKKYRWSKRVSLITTGLSYFDNLRYKSISRDFEITKSPIHVLGFWRSGTTLLHNLLCCYKHVAYPTTYHNVFPNNLFFLQGLIKGIVQFLLPERRLVDRVKMHVDYPQEEEIALGNESGFSFYYWFYFPKDHQKISDEFLTFSSDDPEKYKKYQEGYKRFIKRCLLDVGEGQYIGKNPPNMGRIPFLLDLFPESRFVYINRNPYEVLLSTYRFYKGFLKTLQLQDIDDETLWDFIFHSYNILYHKYQEDKRLISSENLVELEYQDLIADPEGVFESLHQGMFSDLEPDKSKLDSIIYRNVHHAPNVYNFERQYIKRVNSKLGDLIEKQGYRKL